MIGDNTGIAGPIASAVQRLKNSDAKRKVMVLFTDGSNNVDARLTPLQTAKLASEFKVVIYTVGIGSSRSFVRQKSVFGERFLAVEDEFDEALLKELAKLTEGRYYAASDAEGLRKAMEEIDKLEKTTVDQPRYVEYREWAPHIAWLALLLLVAGFVGEHTLFLKIP
jgi:Ca-activated chloride channel family protein